MQAVTLEPAFFRSVDAARLAPLREFYLADLKSDEGMSGGPVYLVEKRRRHRRGEAVVVMRSEAAVSERRACGLMQLHRGTRRLAGESQTCVRLYVEEKLRVTIAH